MKDQLLRLIELEKVILSLIRLIELVSMLGDMVNACIVSKYDDHLHLSQYENNVVIYIYEIYCHRHMHRLATHLAILHRQ